MSAFQSFHPSFEKITGTNPQLELLLEKNYPFAHEAGVFIPDRDEFFITSNRLIGPDGQPYVEVSKIRLKDSNAIENDTQHASTSVECEVITDKNLVMSNGGVNWGDRVLFCTQGSMTFPSSLVAMSSTAPYETEVIISNFHHRPFNSVNDVVVHSDGSIWFTDPAYGYEQGYRPKPRLPSHVYRFDPTTRAIRVMADGFGHPNGLCFSPDEKILYVTDTDWVNGNGTYDETKAASM
jgi:gluconolactonase